MTARCHPELDSGSRSVDSGSGGRNDNPFMKYSSFVKPLSAVSLLLFLLLGYFRPITALTQDLGRHLLTGQLILQAHTVPKVNLYAYTFPDFPFINHHWLSEVAFALLYQWSGFIGLFILMLLLVIGAFGIQIKYVFSKATALSLSIAGLLYLRILFERTDLRPEVFSFFLLSVFVTLLYYFRGKTSPLLFLLVPLQLLWVNLHIYFAIGLVVIGLFFLDALITHRKNLIAQPVKQLVIVFLLSCAASFINPNGLDGLLYPLRVFQNYGYTIEENQTVFFLQALGFHKPSFPFFFSAVFLLFLSLIASYKKTRPVDWLLAVSFTILGVMAVRNFPLFVFATFIPFSLFFPLLVQRAEKLLPPIPFLKRYSAALSLAFIISLFTWQFFSYFKDKEIGYGVDPSAENAVRFLQKQNIKGPLFNNFDIGSFLIYKLYLSEWVFVDGRPEAYPADFFTKTYIPMQQNPKVFDEVANKYGIQTIFYAHTDQTPWGDAFLKSIVAHPDWRIVYLDEYAIILLRKTPENEPAIKRLGMDRSSLRVSLSTDSFNAHLRLASFFSKVGWDKEGEPHYLALLRYKPEFCPAIGLLTQMYQAEQNPAAEIYAQKYSLHCL